MLKTGFQPNNVRREALVFDPVSNKYYGTIYEIREWKFFSISYIYHSKSGYTQTNLGRKWHYLVLYSTRCIAFTRQCRSCEHTFILSINQSSFKMPSAMIPMTFSLGLEYLRHSNDTKYSKLKLAWLKYLTWKSASKYAVLCVYVGGGENARRREMEPALWLFETWQYNRETTTF